jgi:uncharacterized Zn-binding protein involved in type VI secretion
MFAAKVAIPASITGFPLPPLGPGMVEIGATTVMIEGSPAARVGDLTTPHGNPVNPKMPGFNVECDIAVLTPIGSSTTVWIEGKPAARLGTMCSCMQHKVTIAATTVTIGK